MQITETSTSGLKHEFKIVVGAGDIDAQIQTKLKTLGQQVRLPGFRPGKAPVSLLKKQYGKAVLGEVLQETVNNITQQTIRDRSLRPAMEPKIEVTKFEEGTDLEYTMAVEVLPVITPTDFKQIKLEKLVTEVGDDEVDTMVKGIAEQQKAFEKIAEDRPAAKGDAVLIDFLGKVDGVAFEGGAGKDHQLELGSNSFIPGFEDQLIGAKAGAHVLVNVTFPAEYGNKELAGKAATFDVDVKEIRAAKPVALDDELAKRLGLENLEQLRDAVRKQIGQDVSGLTRNRLKRSLLDALAASHDFGVPQGMVDMEFEQIWSQFTANPAESEAELKASGKTEDQLKAEYRAIAERRVRLGLLLSEVGRTNNIDVKPDEVTKAIIEQARRFPGQERQVMEYFQKNAEAMAQLRAPLFEEKVVDFVLEMASVTERKVTREELMREPDEAAKPAG